MRSQPPFPGHSPAQYQPFYPPFAHTGIEGQLSKRDRSAAGFTNSTKRKASASAAEDPESKDMSGVESTADLEPLGLQEADKRLKVIIYNFQKAACGFIL
jgi:hypothetical protein